MMTLELTEDRADALTTLLEFTDLHDIFITQDHTASPTKTVRPFRASALKS